MAISSSCSSSSSSSKSSSSSSDGGGRRRWLRPVSAFKVSEATRNENGNCTRCVTNPFPIIIIFFGNIWKRYKEKNNNNKYIISWPSQVLYERQETKIDKKKRTNKTKQNDPVWMTLVKRKRMEGKDILEGWFTYGLRDLGGFRFRSGHVRQVLDDFFRVLRFTGARLAGAQDRLVLAIWEAKQQRPRER